MQKLKVKGQSVWKQVDGGNSITSRAKAVGNLSSFSLNLSSTFLQEAQEWAMIHLRRLSQISIQKVACRAYPSTCTAGKLCHNPPTLQIDR